MKKYTVFIFIFYAACVNNTHIVTVKSKKKIQADKTQGNLNVKPINKNINTKNKSLIKDMNNSTNNTIQYSISDLFLPYETMHNIEHDKLSLPDKNKKTLKNIYEGCYKKYRARDCFIFYFFSHYHYYSKNIINKLSKDNWQKILILTGNTKYFYALDDVREFYQLECQNGDMLACQFFWFYKINNSCKYTFYNDKLFKLDKFIQIYSSKNKFLNYTKLVSFLSNIKKECKNKLNSYTCALYYFLEISYINRKLLTIMADVYLSRKNEVLLNNIHKLKNLQNKLKKEIKFIKKYPCIVFIKEITIMSKKNSRLCNLRSKSIFTYLYDKSHTEFVKRRKSNKWKNLSYKFLNEMKSTINIYNKLLYLYSAYYAGKQKCSSDFYDKLFKRYNRILNNNFSSKN